MSSLENFHTGNCCRVYSDFALIEFSQVSSLPGDLTFVEGGRHIPFGIKRVYYMYNVPEDGLRGNHAHKQLHQILIAVSGSFEVKLDNGFNTNCVYLDKPNLGLYIPPMTWRVLKNFSHDAICLVLASEFYEESDYYRNYEEFLEALRDSNS